MKHSNNGDAGIWKSASGKGRKGPKGRQLDEAAYNQVVALLGDTPKRRDLLIEYLHRIQDAFNGLQKKHLKALGEWLNLPESEVAGVASFYSHFDLLDDDQHLPEITLRVCNSLSCCLAGSDWLAGELQQTCDSNTVRVLRAPCMGRCNLAPTVSVGRTHIDNATPDNVIQAITGKQFEPRLPDYECLDQYLLDGGYQVFKSLQQGDVSAQSLEQQVLDSGLRGMGGAGFPSGRKWSAVRSEPGPRYMAVNADEGEPGTFKDRYYLESRPHLVLEGMLLAALAVEAEKIYIYVRDEYPVALKILQIELQSLHEQGLIPCDWVELRRGAGAYICGEESAMIESIEGKRGLPRHRPPYVAQQGLFGQPTLVHNVETLYWTARICREGASVLADVEHNGRKGLRTYSVSGRVNNPGIYMLPSGSTITDIIAAAGGMLSGHTFTAYQPGGPASGILPASQNNVPLDFDTLQPLGSLIGSAAVVILSDKDSVKAAAINMLEFFHHESCGQCTPCRVGCGKAVSLMKMEHWDKALLEELGSVMTDASICGLGQAAPNPFRTVIRYFPDEVSKDAD
ncbi:NAD(P)H-dependent oxidoreductase subunit E [Shewanella corallii]|uniref:NADH-quinone oxidoreductase subunit F n=1 Tax=Shewanella corallii TaxID=560080 RepID=A0ABT0N7Z6_9GAMM|nr:NAD(P)H-dependent oxidoreductase subunit E [Shewanella corallii]MCL2914215.1 NAD(P)H-dependent oxidoreductase subunit E [Shewanella corallii]